jgi:predicted metal-binding membrane protein
VSSGATVPRRLPALPRAGLAALVIGIALVAWIATAARMGGMDDGPGTDLGGVAWYLGVWVTMMAAMMLPSAVPAVLVVARVGAARGEPRAPAAFVAGYLVAWTVFGLLAYGAFRLIRALDPPFLGWDAHGALVAGAAVAAAGLYQLTKLKLACLRHCRSPLQFVMRAWRPGPLGVVRVGAGHGAWCIGCCGGLMLILFALGVMSVLWMAIIAAAIFAEKVLPLGPRARIALGVAFVVLGAWIAIDPGSVPGLHEPGHDMQQMTMAVAGRP